MKRKLLILLLFIFNNFVSYGQLDLIIKELNLNRDSVNFDLAGTKNVINSNIIFAILVFTENIEGNYWKADLFLVKYDTLKKEIIAKSRFQNILTSDAVMIHKLWIDTAPYFLQDEVKSIGIHTISSNNSSVDFGEFEEVFIFEEFNGNFFNLLNIETRQFISNRGLDCENTQERIRKCSLKLDKNKTNNHFNIYENVITEEYNLTENCEEGRKKIRKFRNLYIFENGKYKCLNPQF